MHLLFPLLALTATTTTAAVLPPQSPLTPLNPSTSTSSHEDSLCPLPPRINLPASQHLHPALTFLHDPSYRDRQIERLSRAVRIPTTVTDFMTDPYDPGFEVFGRFHDVLREMFPLVYAPSFSLSLSLSTQ